MVGATRHDDGGMSPAKIRVAILEDDAFTLSGIVLHIEGSSDLVVLVATGDVRAFLREVETEQPDIAVLDLRIRGVKYPEYRDYDEYLIGFVVLERLWSVSPSTGVIINTAHDDDGSKLERAIEFGVHGFISKADPDGSQYDLLEAIRCVHRGESFYPRSQLERLPRLGGAMMVSEVRLRPQEAADLSAYRKLRSVKAVADETMRAYQSVYASLKRAANRLGVGTFDDAVRAAVLRRLI